MRRMGHTPGSNDALLALVRYAPLLFVIGGVLLVMWLSRQRSSHELQPDVLAALSEDEALPALAIRRRPPLDQLDVDGDMLVRVLDELCGLGLAVRWYETVEAERQVVYRRIRSLTEMAS
jgi:hypothetical protein